MVVDWVQKLSSLKEFAKLVSSKYAAVTSNSPGQDLVMKALGIKDVDKSIQLYHLWQQPLFLWNNLQIFRCSERDLNIDQM